MYASVPEKTIGSIGAITKVSTCVVLDILCPCRDVLQNECNRDVVRWFGLYYARTQLVKIFKLAAVMNQQELGADKLDGV